MANRTVERFGVAVGLLAVTVATGCNEQGDATKTRLEALEGRLTRIESRLSNAEKDIPDAQALRDEIKGMDGRIAAAEARATEALGLAKSAPAAPAPGVAAVPNGAVPPPSNPAEAAMIDRARRDALASLNQQDRQRLQAMRGAQDAGADTAQRRDQRRELSRWFREQRRAILLGQAATAPPAP
jgi:hypothetical protein